MFSLRLSILVAALAGLLFPTRGARAESDDAPVAIKIDLPGARRIAIIEVGPQDLRYEVTWTTGEIERMTPQQFTAALHRARTERSWLHALFNVDSALGVAWVTLGLVGQVIFAGRMLVQWIHSERQGRSAVPVVFWWMSLVGASMLMAYFIWRRDIVGILGQSMGWMIYLRNLVLIYRRAHIEQA